MKTYKIKTVNIDSMYQFTVQATSEEQARQKVNRAIRADIRKRTGQGLPESQEKIVSVSCVKNATN